MYHIRTNESSRHAAPAASLLARVDAHLRATRIKAIRFGRNAVNDPNFVADLREGRKVGPKVRARVIAHIEGRANA